MRGINRRTFSLGSAAVAAVRFTIRAFAASGGLTLSDHLTGTNGLNSSNAQSAA